MPDLSQTISVSTVSHGGGADLGRSVYFDARADDGSLVRIMLPHTQVSAFIAKLMAFAGAAKRERDESEVNKDNPLEYAEMLDFQGIQISPLADWSGVAIQFLIQEGVTMVFPLQTRFIPRVAESLQKWHAGLVDQSQAGRHDQ